jgi:hypothetical protein
MRGRCLSWVNRVVLTMRRPLPVFPDQRTFSESVGMSQRCHEQSLRRSQPMVRCAANSGRCRDADCRAVTATNRW